ncbi:manganese catalase family protein [Actinopolymorpha singaporensis]
MWEWSCRFSIGRSFSIRPRPRWLTRCSRGSCRDLLFGIGAEEFGHVEMLATMIAQLLEGAPVGVTEGRSRTTQPSRRSSVVRTCDMPSSRAPARVRWTAWAMANAHAEMQGDCRWPWRTGECRTSTSTSRTAWLPPRPAPHDRTRVDSGRARTRPLVPAGGGVRNHRRSRADLAASAATPGSPSRARPSRCRR